MSSTSRRVVLALALAAAACASNPAPHGWLPNAKEAQRSASGAWISVRCEKREPVDRVAGELIALDAERVYILTDAGLVTVPSASVKQGTLAAYETDAGGLAAWGALGSASTLSHGHFLIFTAPTWILATAATTQTESRAAQVRYPEKPFASFRPYARFPQGLPPGFEPSVLGRPRQGPPTLHTTPRKTDERPGGQSADRP